MLLQSTLLSPSPPLELADQKAEQFQPAQVRLGLARWKTTRERLKLLRHWNLAHGRRCTEQNYAVKRRLLRSSPHSIYSLKLVESCAITCKSIESQEGLVSNAKDAGLARIRASSRQTTIKAFLTMPNREIREPLVNQCCQGGLRLLS